MEKASLSSGIVALDKISDGFRQGDNVVWQVDTLEDYFFFTEPFAAEAIRNRGSCVYLRFAPHPPVVQDRPGLVVEEVDPGLGFAYFTDELHRLIEKHSEKKYFILDNLSSLVEQWATDELLANFFQVTCPFLGELDTVAYFALLRGRHSNSAVARIRDTTQVLVDVYRTRGKMYVHPLKVWDRYSPQMFLPHSVEGEEWKPVFYSGEAADITAKAHRHPLRVEKHSSAPWDTVYSKLVTYWREGGDPINLTPEFHALKQETIHMLIGSDPELKSLGDTYFTVEDLFDIRERMIGTGRIGGKTTGMLLARKILQENKGKTDFSTLLEHHDSFYIGSDVFFTFLVDNNLFRLRLQFTNNADLTWEEFAQIEEDFQAGTFPADIMEEFRNMLDYFGQAPIIVRSSSLLEDSFGNAFAGKYRSEFCANQGSPEERLEKFLQVVKLVYASTLSPDVLAYRLKRGLAENDEQMAILVQRVAGLPYRKYFFPSLAGVAFSHNLYAWSERIDPQQGLIRLVFGLGTRAVNRVADDYPRMVAISHPQLRPESSSQIFQYSQQFMDLLDIESNQFLTLPVTEVLRNSNYPQLHYFASLLREGTPFDPPYASIPADGEEIVLTFNRLLEKTPFAALFREMLERLEEAYGHPVDTEFTASVLQGGKIRINMLQCRPLWLPSQPDSLKIPRDVSPEKILFMGQRVVNFALVEGIRYIIYVHPRGYESLEDDSLRRQMGRLIGSLNRHPLLAEEKLMLMGPGRWGSSNIHLGINTGYADLDNVSILVELACEKAGQFPEVSYGTHFFQDLVEAQITYLPVYPDLPRDKFNHAFFQESPSILETLVPTDKSLQEAVRVIDVSAVTGGTMAKLVADPQSGRALCCIEENPEL